MSGCELELAGGGDSFFEKPAGDGHEHRALLTDERVRFARVDRKGVTLHKARHIDVAAALVTSQKNAGTGLHHKRLATAVEVIAQSRAILMDGDYSGTGDLATVHLVDRLVDGTTGVTVHVLHVAVAVAERLQHGPQCGVDVGGGQGLLQREPIVFVGGRVLTVKLDLIHANGHLVRHQLGPGVGRTPLSTLRPGHVEGAGHLLERVDVEAVQLGFPLEVVECAFGKRLEDEPTATQHPPTGLRLALAARQEDLEHTLADAIQQDVDAGHDRVLDHVVVDLVLHVVVAGVATTQTTVVVSAGANLLHTTVVEVVGDTVTHC